MKLFSPLPKTVLVAISFVSVREAKINFILVTQRYLRQEEIFERCPAELFFVDLFWVSMKEIHILISMSVIVDTLGK